ncbi:neutral/alkaline non-lysosomal ceramidase N-terminal domain-containing protein [Horticoccus sp. 23ND18S-11]|uniref:neutral/alkaline non-lysosomal ceramidase N-terminal domain-containing protein n=1 Tax=Horticoccus sp. 23ND18S-11 TaxID=3391832 RepID=UPI0039C9B61C
MSKTRSTVPARPVFAGVLSPFLPAVFIGCIALALQLAAGSALAADSASWRAGTGRASITPPAGLWMTGYAVRDRPADGTAQELWVKALAVSDPAGNRGVILTLDLCDVTREVSDRVAASLMTRFAIPRSAIITNVSHTHCAPWMEGGIAGLRIFPPEGVAKAVEFRHQLETKMVQAAADAFESLAPATISWGEDAATFGFNRRENPEAQAPALRAAGKLKGPFDPRVPVLAVHGPDGALRGLLVSYACHNTTLSLYQWHGDYAGCAQAELEKRHPGATVLFAIGCGADINPAPRREIAHAEQHGRDLADATDRALRGTMKKVDGGFASAFEDLTLTFARIPTAAQLREAMEKNQPNKEMHQAWSAAITRQLKEKGDAIRFYQYPIQAWRLGNLSWVALGGEVVIDYALRLGREMPGPLWVFGYSTDVMAYIPSERVLKEGRYEGETSMIPHGRPGPWTPGLEDKIVGKTVELVARTKQAAAR